MVPIYSLVSFLSYYYYVHTVYYQVLRDCYEAFAIASFFSLICAYIAPDLHEQKEYFRGIRPRRWVWPASWGKKEFLRTPRSGLTWFNVSSAQQRYSRMSTDTYSRSFGSACSSTASLMS